LDNCDISTSVSPCQHFFEKIFAFFRQFMYFIHLSSNTHSFMHILMNIHSGFHFYFQKNIGQEYAMHPPVRLYAVKY